MSGGRDGAGRVAGRVMRRAARELAPAAEARILEIPFDLGVITQTMYWHPRMESDLAHRWLRE